MLYGKDSGEWVVKDRKVLILIFLENALRRMIQLVNEANGDVLILIFLENALRRVESSFC